MDIVSLVGKDHCTGCTACMGSCPMDAISMISDDEGFLYPAVNAEKCVDCSVCAGVCPVLNKVNRNKEVPECYAAWSKNDELRIKSSSGGIFGLLATETLRKNGVVVGAAFTDDFYGVEHIMVDTEEELQRLRGSKYVQSDMKNILRQVRDKLESGREVLFSGTPCQVAGLYSYLGGDYDNLTTVDIVCHGVPSPGVYRTYIKEMEVKYSSKIKSINMRDKSNGFWGQSTGISFENGRKDLVESENCSWKDAFLSHITLRTSCHNCKYCSTSRFGDITLGDFWGIGKVDQSLFDKQGNSVVLVNSHKGQLFWDAVASKLFSYLAPLEIPKTNNANLNNNPPSRNGARERFFFEWKKTSSFEKALKRIKDKKFDVGIVGWWYYENYGAALTVYGLKKWLEKQGFSSVLIDKYEEKYGSATSKKHLKVRRFANSYAESIQVKKESQLIELNNNCDIFISGSDQMWNPDFKGASGWENYLDFVFEHKKKISYASSFGDSTTYNASVEDTAKVQYLLNRFDHISVRENAGKAILRDVFHIDAPHVVDPVFLLDKEDYSALQPVNFRPVEQPYLLAYFVVTTERVAAYVKSVSEQMGLRVVFILDPDPNTREKAREGILAGGISEDCMVDAEVADFVHYIKNAKYFVTDSFHGLCFSCIFEKNFMALFARQNHERLVSLLKTVHLEDRIVRIDEQIADRHDLFKDIDFSATRKALNKQSEASKMWLIRALSEPKEAKELSCYDSLRTECLLLNEKNRELEWRIAALKKQLEETANIVQSLTEVQKNTKTDSKKAVRVANLRKLFFGFFACLKEHGTKYTVRRVLVKLRLCKG